MRFIVGVDLVQELGGNGFDWAQQESSIHCVNLAKAAAWPMSSLIFSMCFAKLEISRTSAFPVKTANLTGKVSEQCGKSEWSRLSPDPLPKTWLTSMTSMDILKSLSLSTISISRLKIPQASLILPKEVADLLGSTNSTKLLSWLVASQRPSLCQLSHVLFL